MYSIDGALIKFMLTTIENLKVALWEKRELDDRNYNKETKEWIKTGNKVEKTLYTLRDEFGEVLKFLAGNEYRDMEGSIVRLTLKIEYNEFTNLNKISLVELTQMEKKK